MVGEFLNSVCWGKLDYLVIDTPPGTSDEHITVLEHLQKSTSDVDVGIIIVSTPQRVSLCDVSREIGFCMKTNMKIIGLIENMSGYKCPNCTQCTNLFSYGGAEALAVEKNVRFLGRLPFDSSLTVACDRAGDFQSKIYTSENTKLLTEKILSVLSV
ncbi:putative nucleotide binding protein 2 (nbp 2) [Schistosoma mansoni]|nr:putative nucleotide binding protein 2 (nbp 2) [Schistosoma mansoni]|eukprot:XP_018649205.1 putative nucleotide binding protein 2 (nbp 2) [Schistosoma mansoni]